MIIRKPYAFFIKHFRLFHIIFVLLAFGLVVSNISLFEFFDDYVSTTPAIVSSYIADLTYVNIIWNFILIIGLIIVMGVLIYKKKDIKMYIVLILVYIFVTVLYIYSNTIISDLTRYLVDIRIVKAIHDILLVTVFVQSIMLALLFSRATGFDIKKFDFARDYAMINADSKDREEVEVNLEFDFNAFKTKINKFIRNFKYFYLENKLVFISVCIIGLIILFSSIYMYYKNTLYVDIKDNSIKSSKYIVNVNDIFIDNTDINDNIINDSNFVILKADIIIRSGSRNSFNSSNLVIVIGNNSYVPLKQFNQYFTDFGNPYNDEVIENNGSYYFVYSIPSNIELDKMKLVYTDINKYYQMNVNYIDLRNNVVVGNYGIGDNILINNNFMKNVNFNISEVSFRDKFLVPYIYKNSNEFYSSSYYVSPSIKGNYDKSVVRFVSNNCDLIDKYGIIYYDNNRSNVSLKKIEPLKSSDYCYFETDRNVLNASSIYLELNVRSNLYKYYLK